MIKIVYCSIISNQLKRTLMTTFPPDQDSRIPQLAAQDWERREARAAQLEAAEIRRQSLQRAQEIGPLFELYRLPQNFWVAVLPVGEMPGGQRGSSTPQANVDRIIFQSGFANAIEGCTDLHPIGDHLLFFRSNRSEQEIRENIDLSFLPF